MRTKVRKNFRQLLQYIKKIFRPKKGKGSYARKKSNEPQAW